jgi:serine/threonine protein kinase
MNKPSWIGVTLNKRYKIDALLGQGGMSAVYKASDPNLKRVVAIKLIHEHLSGDQQFVNRFEEEAAAVAQLRHPNIVQVYDFSHDEDTYYMVLEFIPGESLNDRLKRLNQAKRYLSISEALRILSQVCDAVDYAHKRGLVHRDIKPANVMLDVHGQAILMDFGIVKILGGEKHTATGAVLGTAFYMSPEQVRGEAAEPRSDIYALGVTLFEMLSGNPPFQADSVMTVLMMHLTDPVPDLRSLRSDVPAEVVAIIEKAMAKDARGRYQTAAEMAAAMRLVLARYEETAESVQPAAEATVIEPPVPIQPEAPAVKKPADATYVESVKPSSSSPAVQKMPASNAAAFASKVDTGPMKPVRVSTSTPMAARPATGAASSGAHQPAPASADRSASQPHRLPTRDLSSTSTPKPFPWLFVAGGGLGIVVIFAIVVIAVIIGLTQNGDQENQAILSARATQTSVAALLIEDTPAASSTPTQQAATPTVELTATSAPTATLEPTVTPTSLPTEVPTPTVPPGIPYVRINKITLDDQYRYVVEYETFEFTEKLPGTHIHFFFNTVPADQAGMPGSGPWILYGGPRPFTGYKVSDKPAAATKMCALVANSNHSVQQDSGNCYTLP